MNDINEREPGIRIISACPAVAEQQLNELAGRYAPIVWNVAPTEAGIMVTVVMLHERELRKQNLAQAMMAPPGMRRQ